MSDTLNARLMELLRCVYGTSENEIDSLTWDTHAARVAEMVAHGKSLEDIEPTLQQYLKNAPDCREEFLALVAMIQAEAIQENKE